MAANITTFPPDTLCFVWSQNITDGAPQCTNFTETVTQAMVDYLNLTSGIGVYKQAYCVNPQAGDSCPFGYCPQPDIAGPLVRISSYITTFCLAILLFYSPESVKESFFSSILTIYSILITCSISIFQKNLTKFHALIAATIVGSPLTMYMGLYSLRSLWGNKHRLDDIVGRGKIVQRTMVLGTVTVWLAFVIYLLLPSNMSYFAQASCDQYSTVVKLLFFLPLILFAVAVIYAPVWAAAAISPIIGVALSWVLIIIIRRRTIWPNASTKRWQFWAVWALVRDEYPFVYFMSAVVVPSIYWVITVEVAILDSPADNEWTLSFGQVLAMFVTVPPMLAVVRLLPGAWSWFIDLSWTRLLTGRPQRRVPRHQPSADSPLAKNMPAGETTIPLRARAASDGSMYKYADAWDAKADEAEYGYGGMPTTPPGLGSDAKGRYEQVDYAFGGRGPQVYEAKDGRH